MKIFLKAIGILLLFMVVATWISMHYIGFFGPRNSIDFALSEAIQVPIITFGLFLAIRFIIKQFANKNNKTVKDHPYLAGIWRTFSLWLLMLGVYSFSYGVVYINFGYNLQKNGVLILITIGIVGLIGGALRTIWVVKSDKLNEIQPT